MNQEEASASMPSTAPPLPPLDEVMVAMDVVDTLRHEEDLVRQELTGDERREALVRRLQDLYANQGIVVPEEVIRKGVYALEEDRFTYVPPENSWSVSLAKLYIRRGFIGKWILALSLLALVLWGVYAIPKQIEQSRRQKAFAVQAKEVAADEQSEFEALRRLFVQHARLQDSYELSSMQESLLGDALSKLDQADVLKADIIALQSAEEIDEANIYSRVKKVDQLQQALKHSRATLNQVQGMLKFEPEITQVLAAATGSNLDVDARAAVEGIAARARAMNQAGDAKGAGDELAHLRDMIRELNTTYELRIISSQTQRSGVFRESARGGRFKNYYIIVQAVDAKGRPVKLSFSDEELGRRVTAHTFGVRVAESVYEQVKADKLDNQIIDRPLFAKKPAGTSKLKYFYKTSGGRITRW